MELKTCRIFFTLVFSKSTKTQLTLQTAWFDRPQLQLKLIFGSILAFLVSTLKGLWTKVMPWINRFVSKLRFKGTQQTCKIILHTSTMLKYYVRQLARHSLFCWIWVKEHPVKANLLIKSNTACCLRLLSSDKIYPWTLVNCWLLWEHFLVSNKHF